MMNSNRNWFKYWFNTPYYHLLYNKRNHKEAQLFMTNLVFYLKLKPGDLILDLACGKGRHSIYLNQLGFTVTGMDLSENSINVAKKSSTNSLEFIVQDMRQAFENKYDAIFNLFTSFGYFKDDAEDLKVLQNIKAALKPNGVAVIDYLNIHKAIAEMIPEEIEKRGPINFHINRLVADNFINKEIRFNADNNNFFFSEHVKCLDLNTFKAYFKALDLQLVDSFGDYNLNPFDETNSERLILIFK